MRLDKYLKLSRIIKRRTVSKDIILLGKVNINGKKAKPSSEVKINDIISLILGNKIIEIKVLSINEKVNKEQAISLYEIVSEKGIENEKDNW